MLCKSFRVRNFCIRFAYKNYFTMKNKQIMLYIIAAKRLPVSQLKANEYGSSH